MNEPGKELPLGEQCHFFGCHIPVSEHAGRSNHPPHGVCKCCNAATPLAEMTGDYCNECGRHRVQLEDAALDRVKAYIKRARSFQLDACSKDYILHGILNDIENEIAGKPTTSLTQPYNQKSMNTLENPIRPKDCQWEPINAEFRRCIVHGGTAMKDEFERDTWGHVPTVRCHVQSNALTESEATAKAFYEDKSFVNIEAIARSMAAQLNVNQTLVSQALKDALLGEYGQECK